MAKSNFETTKQKVGLKNATKKSLKNLTGRKRKTQILGKELRIWKRERSYEENPR